jgi:hypothetical protein
VPKQRAPKKAKRSSSRSPSAPTSQMPAAGAGGGGRGSEDRGGGRDSARGGEVKEPTITRDSAAGGGRWVHAPS